MYIFNAVMFKLSYCHIMSLLLIEIVYSNKTLPKSKLVKIENIKRIQHDSKLEGKIIQGVPISIERFPFQAQVYNLGSLCSGTIMNSWTILTVAHCFDHNRELLGLKVQTGSRYAYDFNARKYDVHSLIIHKAYNTTSQFDSDIALLFVQQPLVFGKCSQKAILVDNSDWMNDGQNGFIVSGWGWTKYGGPISKLGLMTTSLSFVASQKCGRLHNISLTPNMFCLYGDGERDTCKGDSGSGVLWNGYIVGITSHGDGCAKKNKPSVYTNVWYFKGWIKRNIVRFFKLVCNQNDKAKRLKQTSIQTTLL